MMMNRKTRTLQSRSRVLLALLLLLCQLLPLLPIVAADSAPTLQYRYANAKQGDAAGEITITPGSKTSGYYNLYFADENGILEAYEPIATVSVKSTAVKVNMPQAMLLPPDASRIALYISTTKAPSDLSLSAAAAIYEIPSEKRITLGESVFSFASVSDAHLNYDDNGYGASAKWTAALNFFAEKKMEAVILSGDITSSGGTTDYDRYAAATAASAYPASQIYEAQGNHDSTQVARFLSYTAGADQVHPYSGSAYFYKLFPGKEGEKDNLFIFMAQELSSTGATPSSNNFSTRQLDWVEGLLQTYSGTDTNIYLVEHAMMRNFGPGDRYNGVYVEPMMLEEGFPGNMRLKALLTEYKEMIMMSGHTHLSFYENCNFSDENGSAARMIHNSSTSQPRSYTSGGSISYNSEGKTTATAGSEGYLVYVYHDYITYLGHNLTTGKVIPQACFLLDSYSEDRTKALSITVTTPPEKTAYTAGEWFSGSGMVVEATYADGHTAAVRGWSCSNVGALKAGDTSVEITYGSCEPVSVSITVKQTSVHGENFFEGSGSAVDPFLIQTPEDFAALTTLFNASTSSTSPCGKGYFYRQTADIDMTDFEGYQGTNASGNGKRYFAGCYDGDGHTLTVAISASGDASVFPYIYGAITNLRIRGYITGSSAAQPIRTIQAGAVVANCDFALKLTSSKSSGVCYTNYATIYNVFTHCTADYAVAATNNGKYYNVFQYSFKSSGSSLSDSKATRTNHWETIATAFNDRTSEAAIVGCTALEAVSAYLSGATLCEAAAGDDGIVFTSRSGGGEVGGGIFSGSGSKEDPYKIGTAREFALLTELFNASTDSASPYGKDLYFEQTADIDMTDYPGYAGTAANGDAKCYFGGFYNGAGHTITVNIPSGAQVSIFPYITAAIYNLRFRGSITSTTSAQPIRTVQSGAVVANCDIEMQLSSKLACGVAYTNYATIFNVYTRCTATKAVCSSNSGKYLQVYTNSVTAAGAALTSSGATAEADPKVVAAVFNDRNSSAAKSAWDRLAKLDMTSEDLLAAYVQDGELYFGEEPILPGDINGDGTVSIQDVTVLLTVLSGAATEYDAAVLDLSGDGRFSIQDVTVLLTMLAAA